MRVVVVCGPPGSGKSTYVRNAAAWGDLVIDFDRIYSALSGLPEHEKPGNLFDYVDAVRQALYRKLDGSVDNGKAWVVMGGARKRDRERFPGAQIILLKKSVGECLRNLMKDPARRERLEEYRPMIEKWWKQYEE
jgi:predicted kinase